MKRIINFMIVYPVFFFLIIFAAINSWSEENKVRDESITNQMNYIGDDAYFSQDDIDKGRIILSEEFNYPESSISKEIDIPIIDEIEWCGILSDNIRNFVTQRPLGTPYAEIDKYLNTEIEEDRIKPENKETFRDLMSNFSNDGINPEYLRVLRDLSYRNSLCASNLLSYYYSTVDDMKNDERAIYFALNSVQIQIKQLDKSKVKDHYDFSIPLLASRIINNYETFDNEAIQQAFFLLDYHIKFYDSLFAKLFLADILTNEYQFRPITSGLRSKNFLNKEKYQSILKNLLNIFRTGGKGRFYDETESFEELWNEYFDNENIMIEDIKSLNDNITEGINLYNSCTKNYDPFNLVYLNSLPPYKIECLRKNSYYILSGESDYSQKRKALLNLQIMSDNGDSSASLIVANSYCKGIGTKIDEQVSRNYYQKTLEQGNTDVALTIAAHHESGRCGYPKNVQIAKDMYTLIIDEIADKNEWLIESAKENLALLLHSEGKKGEAYKILKELNAYVLLYNINLGVETIDKAEEYLYECYDKGRYYQYITCGREIGRLLHGDLNLFNLNYGSDEDLKEGCLYFKDSALQGNAASYQNLANCYHKGLLKNSNDYEVNPRKAAYWYKAALEVDDIEDEEFFNFLDEYPQYYQFLSNYNSIMEIGRKSEDLFGKNRIAIIIGSENYIDSDFTDIPQVKYDFQDMSNILEELGFRGKDSFLLNPTFHEIINVVQRINREFANSDKPVEIIFYYSGHAITYSGENYLIPIDSSFNISNIHELKGNYISFEKIRNILHSIPSLENIIFILDSCRSNLNPNLLIENEINPITNKENNNSILENDNFVSSTFITKNLPIGLAPIESKSNELIVYSTSPGNISVANIQDFNSMFTKHLIEEIYRTPRTDIETILKNVRKSVSIETKNNQIPWTSSTLTKPFYFPRKNPTRYITSQYIGNETLDF